MYFYLCDLKCFISTYILFTFKNVPSSLKSSFRAIKDRIGSHWKRMIFPRSFLWDQTYLRPQIGGEKNPDLLLCCASHLHLSRLPRARSWLLLFSPPQTYALERVICRPDLENRGSVLDLSTRTQDVGSVRSSGCPYATDGSLAAGVDWRGALRSISMNSLWISCNGKNAQRDDWLSFLISIQLYCHISILVYQRGRLTVVNEIRRTEFCQYNICDLLTKSDGKGTAELPEICNRVNRVIWYH